MANLSFVRSSKLVDLLRQCDPSGKMYVRVLSTSKLALGIDPLQPDYLINLSKEMAGPYEAHVEQEIASDRKDVAEIDLSASHQDIVPKMARRTGDYWFEMNGHRSEHNSLKDLLAEGLRTLEKARPGTLEKLSQIKPRSRRIVARDPKQLFDRSHLAKDFAERLTNEWWFGTNNSANETDSWLIRACHCAGLAWGKDFKTNVSVTELVPSDIL